MSSGELSAVETTASVPIAAPTDSGAKVSANVTLWLGDRVIGNASPLTEKPAPLMVAAEMVAADPPVLVSTSESLEVLPFCTLPNEAVEGDGASAGAALVAVEPTPGTP